MTDEKWQKMWDAAQTVQQHLYVDEILPRRLTVDQWQIAVSVEWDQLGRAATSIFPDAETLPITKFATGEYDHCGVTGDVEGVRVTVATARKCSPPQPAGTVADLLRADQ